MHLPQLAVLCFAVAIALPAWTGCDPHHHGDDSHQHGKQPHAGHGHGHGAESPSGASFKAAKGVMLTDETREILRVGVTDVEELPLPMELRLNVQIFGEIHRPSTAQEEDHSGCDVKGSALLPHPDAALIRSGMPVTLQDRCGETLEGIVLQVHRALAINETEVVVGITHAGADYKDGEFLKGIISMERSEPVMAVPRSAVLRTAEGTFVYAINGDAYLRVPVETGGESGNLVEIKDGVLAGDQVVTNAVETLWLIELRATKGGGHCH